MENWKEELKRLKLEHINRTSPGFFELSGGYKMKLKPYSDKTTNGLTAAVYDWLKYSGHYVNRINTQGQARVEKIEVFGGRTINKITYSHSTTNKGTADIDSIINGKPIKIEIKCAATGDKVRKEQLEEKKRIESAGGIYTIVTDMQGFVQWYKDFVNNKKGQSIEMRRPESNIKDAY